VLEPFESFGGWRVSVWCIRGSRQRSEIHGKLISAMCGAVLLQCSGFVVALQRDPAHLLTCFEGIGAVRQREAEGKLDTCDCNFAARLETELQLCVQEP